MALAHYYENIPGWFDFDDLYRRAVKTCTRNVGASTFVEVGTFLGRSLAYLGVEIVNSKKPIKLVSVDHSEILELPPAFFENLDAAAKNMFKKCEPWEGFHVQEIIRRNMRKCVLAGLQHESMWTDSTRAAYAFEPGSVDFVFLDAAHDYDGIKSEIQAWLPRLRKRGVIAGHDHTALFPGVKQAVDELLPGAEIVRSSFWKQT